MTAMHWILVSVTVLVLGFDLVLALTDWMPTISETVWVQIKEHPFVAFAAGVICGHLFW
jgi:hypothetical protein